jgi:Tfp pilus assembly protein, tip-associated adhesin PilY1
MMMRYSRCLFALAATLMAGSVGATNYTDNFQGKSASLQWTALNDACLTAGDGTGSIPSCASKSFLTDSVGQGALLLTPASNNQTGAILSAFPPFPLSQGIQITFTTYTFGGDSGGTARNGADGIVFFLTDGTQTAPTKTGAEGGSMGYDCSNGNAVYDGVAYGYLGLGIDEYGNFLNTGDNGTNPQVNPNGVNGGIYNSNDTNGSTANGTNSYYSSNSGTIAAGAGPQYQPERIGLRGAGNTNWAWLTQNGDTSYYTGSSSASKVQTACKSGQYVSSHTTTTSHGHTTTTYTYSPIPYNYNAIPGGYAVLPNSEPIANNSSSATRNPAAGTTACVGNSPACTIAWPITYKLTISGSGLLNFSYSYNNGAFQPVLANTDITASNGPLPTSLRFGFSAGTGGSNNVHEITCFQAAPLASNSSAAANTIQSGQVKTSTQVYLASYSTDNWWGSLVADPVQTSATTGTLSVSTVANWDAKCELTGGPCDSLGTNASGTPLHSVTAQSSRALLTWNAGGVPLEWANLSAAQTAILNTNASGTVDSAGQQRLGWLRGVRTNEQLQSPPGNLRARTYVLGDIIDSSPTYVSAPFAGAYPDAFADNLYAGATIPENASGVTRYSGFVSTYATRLNMVYVGGNDGLMHGFEAGSYSSSGVYDTTTNDGKEMIGYMPADVLANKAVEITSPTYSHDYLVDATPAVGDLFYNKTWHTWLVGGVGSSGKEIYALDITNPTNFSETNAASLVQGDWDTSTLPNLGNTVGTPIIARMHNGQWAIIFGDGMGGGAGAGIYIGLVDKTTGAVTFTWYGTGVANDDIAYVTSADLDGDSIADYLYAGDTQGNVWRLDVTSSSAASWGYSKFGNATATPLFVAKDTASPANLQPITTSIVVSSVQTKGNTNRVMLFFGTGQKTPATTTSGDVYDTTGTQTFYGIWDWDMSNWNTLVGTSSQYQYAALSGTQSISRSGLLQQKLAAPETTNTSGPVYGYRMLGTTAVVCWQGTSDCTSGNSQYGWYFDLPDTDEQIIYNPEMISGAVVVSTAIPPVISAIQCNAGTQTGWTMAFNPATGGGLPQSFFPNSSGSFSAGSDGSTTSGIALNAVGTPATLSYGGKIYMVTQTVKGSAALSVVNPPSNDSPARVSWREIRN